MSEITIVNDPRELLALIDKAPPQPSDERCRKILASAVFLSTVVPDDALRAHVLFQRLQTACGPQLSDQWVRSWALGFQGVFTGWRAKALPVIRGFVAEMWQAWEREGERLKANLDRVLGPDVPTTD